MSWTGVVWREAGNWGAAGAFIPREDLGRHTFGSQPEPGQIIEVRGEEWIVASLALGYILVKPRVMRPI